MSAGTNQGALHQALPGERVGGGIEMEVSSVLEFLSSVTGILDETYTTDNIKRVDADAPGDVPFRTNPPRVVQHKAHCAWYRGQPVDEDLVPKVFRKHTAYDEKELILDARRRAYLVSGAVPPYEALDQWLFVMQHHGLATRLLDWTENPLIALYFAVSSDFGKREFLPVVWMMNPHVLNWRCHGCSIIPTTDKNDGVESWEKGVHTVEKGYGFDRFAAIFEPRLAKLGPMAIRPRVVDLRMSVQRSYFTVHGTKQDGINVQLAGSDMERLGFLKKIEMRSAEAKAIRDQLLSFGVGPASLFPDLDGLCAEVNAIHGLSSQDPAGGSQPETGDTQAIL